MSMAINMTQRSIIRNKYSNEAPMIEYLRTKEDAEKRAMIETTP